MAGNSLDDNDDKENSSTTTATGNSDNKNTDIKRARQKDREAKTLYDYLGASPKDSDKELKIRYTTLVKTLHPDSSPDLETQSLYYDLSDINAAWKILKDPKQRQKYDRSLQAKEMTENIESFVSAGIESFVTTGIPFLQKTANSTFTALEKTAVTTAAAMDASSKQAQKVNKQAKVVFGEIEIEQQIKSLEQKSSAELTRASKLQKELVALPTKKLASLDAPKTNNKQQQTATTTLSSGEAKKILRNFQSAGTKTGSSTTLSSDIQLLTEAETKHRDAIRDHQSTERTTQSSALKMEQAMKAEEAALKKLEQAQKLLREAKQTAAQTQELHRKAKAEERMSLQASGKMEAMLKKRREKVRMGLLQQQDVFLDRKANELKKQKSDCEKSSAQCLKEAKELQKKARQKKST